MGRLRGSAAREPCCPGGLTTREGPAALPGGSDPRRELEGCCGGGGLRLGGASGLPVAGTRTCIRSPRASEEPLSLCASLRQLSGRGPRTCWWVGGWRPLGAFPAAPPTLGWERPEGAWDWGPGRAAQARPGGWGGRRGAGARLCLSPLGSTSDPGRPGISGRGVGCECLTLGLLRERRLQPPPPPRLLPLWSPGEAGLPARPRRGGGRKSPETQRSPRRGWSCEGGLRNSEGKEGAQVRERWERKRRWPPRFQLLGDAGGVRGWGAGGGGALAWGAGRDKDQGSLPLASHTPECGSEQRWRECGKPKEPVGRGTWGGGGGLPSIVVSVTVAFLSVFVPDGFAPQFSWIAPHSLPPITPSLPHWLSCGFPLVLPVPLTTPFWVSSILPSAWGTFANDRMSELVLTLNCLELLSLPPTLSFLGSYNVTWPLTISFSSAKMAKALSWNPWRSFFILMCPPETCRWSWIISSY